MDDENTFRFILIVGFAAMTVVGLYYRIRSHTGERIDRRQEGIVILLALRIVALVCFAGIITYMIQPMWMAWSSVPIPIWLRWIGVGVAGSSFILKTWTFHALGKNLTDTVVTREEHSLVTHGPYRLIRHPFYTSFAMDVVGVSLLAANWSFLLLGALVFGVLVVRTQQEEEKLTDRFGQEYRDYMARTGRFLPKMK
jgi:protein-S-isoprenylcysteine O-methyltransferase Ste14